MTALTKARATVRGAGGGPLSFLGAAGAVCLQGGMAMLQGGVVRPARSGQGGNTLAQQGDTATCRVVGIFGASATGGASDGAVLVDVDEGDFLIANAGGVDAVTAAQVDHHCFALDDGTVAGNSAGGTRPIAGLVVAVESGGVYVRLGIVEGSQPRRTVVLQFALSEADTLAGTSAELVSPVSGNIVSANVVVQKAVTTGGNVNVLAGLSQVAGLSAVVANGAAKGSVVNKLPTMGDASRAIAAGGRIQVQTANFAGAGAVSGTVEIGF